MTFLEAVFKQPLILVERQRKISDVRTEETIFYLSSEEKDAAENLSTIRKFALEMLKKMDDKMRLKRRRKKCMRNMQYLTEVFKRS